MGLSEAGKMVGEQVFQLDFPCFCVLFSEIASILKVQVGLLETLFTGR
jgi:hypothetical protein